jgi:adenosylcobinamide kinase/adenosylcobinamide-phosphate guanylyltransferase
MDAWVSNMMLEHKGDSSESLTELVLSVVDQLLEVCRRFPSAYFLVSGEVGLSLVPPYPLGRRFQDLLGLVNQRIAASVDRCYLVVAGMPIEVNRPADS